MASENEKDIGHRKRTKDGREKTQQDWSSIPGKVGGGEGAPAERLPTQQAGALLGGT